MMIAVAMKGHTARTLGLRERTIPRIRAFLSSRRTKKEYFVIACVVLVITSFLRTLFAAPIQIYSKEVKDLSTWKKRCTWGRSNGRLVKGWKCEACKESDQPGQSPVCRTLQPKGDCPKPWTKEEPSMATGPRRSEDGSTTHILDFRVSFIGTHTRQACSAGVLSSSCWDLSRCSNFQDGHLTVYIHTSPELEMLLDFAQSQLPNEIQRVHDPNEACLLILDKSSYDKPEELSSSPIWNGGKNHFVWMSNLIFPVHADLSYGVFDFGAASHGSTTWPDTQIRIGYDVPLFYWPMVKLNQSLAEIDDSRNTISNNNSNSNSNNDQHARRPVLVSFKGQQYGLYPGIWNHHRWLATEFWGAEDVNGDVVVDVKCGEHKTYELTGPHAYEDLLLNSTFVYCPGGGGVNSYRLTESLSAGAIPVVVAGLLPPFYPEMDWSECFVVVPEEEIIDVPRRLRAMSSEEIRSRQSTCRRLYLSTIGQEQTSDGLWVQDGGRRGFTTTLQIWHQRIAHALEARASFGTSLQPQ